jgi:hypothetical protein
LSLLQHGISSMATFELVASRKTRQGSYRAGFPNPFLFWNRFISYAKVIGGEQPVEQADLASVP